MEKNVISREQYECALKTADGLKKGLLHDIEKFKEFIQALLEVLVGREGFCAAPEWRLL